MVVETIDGLDLESELLLMDPLPVFFDLFVTVVMTVELDDDTVEWEWGESKEPSPSFLCDDVDTEGEETEEA